MYWYWLFYNRSHAVGRNVEKVLSTNQQYRRDLLRLSKPPHRLDQLLPASPTSPNNRSTVSSHRRSEYLVTERSNTSTNTYTKVVQSSNIELKLVIGRHKSSLQAVQEVSIDLVKLSLLKSYVLNLIILIDLLRHSAFNPFTSLYSAFICYHP